MPQPKAKENGNFGVVVGSRRSRRLTTGVSILIAALGFGFLGYQVSPDGLMLAEKTLENFFERATRLLEYKPGLDQKSAKCRTEMFAIHGAQHGIIYL